MPYGGTLDVRGADLKGDATALFLTHRDFADPVETDAAWAVRSDGQVLSATVAPTAGGTALLPGIYGAMVRTTARKTLPDGSRRDFDAWSNQLSFAIAPAIVSVTGAPVKIVKVDQVEPHLLADGELMVFAGAERLTRATTSPPDRARSSLRRRPPRPGRRSASAFRRRGRRERAAGQAGGAGCRVGAVVGNRAMSARPLDSADMPDGDGLRRSGRGWSPRSWPSGRVRAAPAGRLAELADRFGLDALETDILGVLWTSAFDAELRVAVVAFDGGGAQVTVRAVAAMFGHAVRVRLSSGSPLLMWRLVGEHELIDGGAALTIDPAILAWAGRRA